MGLKYASGDSANLLNTMTSNLEAASKGMEILKSGSRRLTQAVDGKTLSGAAYEAGQGLFKELIIPTITRVQGALEEIQSDVRVYRNADGNVSGEGYLDEDNLREQVGIKKGSIIVAQGNANLCCWLAEITMEAATAQVHYENASKYEREVDRLQDEISKLEDKIKRLREFSYAVEGLFGDSVNELAIAIQSVKVLNQTTVHSNGTYALPFGTDKTWFKEKKSAADVTQVEEQVLRSILSLEGDALSKLGLTEKQKDWYKRIKRVIGVLSPADAFETLYKDADALWDLVDAISKKYPKVADNFLDSLIWLEEKGHGKAAKLLKHSMKKFNNVTSPIKGLLKGKLDIGKKVGGKLLSTKPIKVLGKGAKFLGKANVIFTLADLGVRGVSQGVTDAIKEQSVGKGVISCGIEMVKNIGPLEGVSIGAAAGSFLGPVGAAVGGVLGGIIGGVNWYKQLKKPQLYDNIKEGAYQLYDDAVDRVKVVGKAVSQEVKSIKNVVGDFFKDEVDAIPKFPNLGFGW